MGCAKHIERSQKRGQVEARCPASTFPMRQDLSFYLQTLLAFDKGLCVPLSRVYISGKERRKKDTGGQLNLQAAESV